MPVSPRSAATASPASRSRSAPRAVPPAAAGASGAGEGEPLGGGEVVSSAAGSNGLDSAVGDGETRGDGVRLGTGDEAGAAGEGRALRGEADGEGERCAAGESRTSTGEVLGAGLGELTGGALNRLDGVGEALGSADGTTGTCAAARSAVQSALTTNSANSTSAAPTVGIRCGRGGTGAA